MAFSGKTVLVTGGARGIGRAVAEAFAGAGARVFVVDVDAEAARRTADRISGDGRTAEARVADVGSESDLQGLFRGLLESGVKLDVLVNNAGIGSPVPLESRTTSDWDRVLAVNLRGPFLCCKLAADLMPPGSAVVNIASTRAFMSEPNTEPYSASKGGVVSLTHSLAVSLAPRRIRVNCISPGWIDVTPSHDESAPDSAPLTDLDHAQHLVGRVGRPQDIAAAALFLADSDQAGFITGTNLTVDGGMTVKMIYV